MNREGEEEARQNKAIKCKKKVRKRGDTRVNLIVFHCISLYQSSSRGSRNRNNEKRREEMKRVVRRREEKRRGEEKKRVGETR